MERREMTAEKFIETYRTEILAEENETGYWNAILLCLYKEKFLEEPDLKLVRIFLMEEENKFFSTGRELTALEKENKAAGLLKKLMESESIFREKDHAVYGETFRNLLENKRKYGRNEEKYIEKCFMDVRKYYVLYEMYQDKYDILYKTLEKKTKFRKYGKHCVFPGGHYCHSPIMDLIISNARKTGLTKKRPDDLNDKVEYDYDEEGRLIMYKHYWPDSEIYTCEFLLYAGEWLLNIYYDRSNGLEIITLRKYCNDLVSEYEYALIASWSYPLVGMCDTIHRETYRYSEKGVLVSAVEEEYDFPSLKQFPREDVPDYLKREKIIFESDEEDCIKGFMRQRMDRDYTEDQLDYAKLSERKRKSTHKTKGRWRRPNYFVR